MQPHDHSLSIEQLEGISWPHDPFPSHVVQESQRLRKVPLNTLDTEGVRLLIGQKIGLPYLVPIALNLLMDNPYAEGNFYPGDLLVSVLGIPESFWKAHPPLNNTMVELAHVVSLRHELTESQLLPALQGFQYA
ncbi:contact-dependent growth inhibition system immunity protein [Chitinimonas naiadis]